MDDNACNKFKESLVGDRLKHETLVYKQATVRTETTSNQLLRGRVNSMMVHRTSRQE